MVVDGAVNGDEFLQTSHAPEPEHGSLSSSKWKVKILSPIVEPAARLLPVRVADDFHRGTMVCGWPYRFIDFLRNFNAALRSRRFVT